MAEDPSGDGPIFDRYLHADEKYYVAPLPTHLKAAAVAAAIEAALADEPPLDQLQRLSRLAIFYDTREAAPAFERLLITPPGTEPDLQSAALAILSLGWIGDADQRETAMATLSRLLDLAQPDRLARQAIYAVFQAWGAALDPALLTAWLARGEERLQDRLAAAERGGDRAAAEDIELQLEEIRYFARREAGWLILDNAARRRLEALPTAERIDALAAEALPGVSANPGAFADWAAITLVHQANADPAVAALAAAAFLRLSQRFVRAEEVGAAAASPGPPPSARWAAELDPVKREADLNRAACLRAAAFFGADLAGGDAAWLDRQSDLGTDLLHRRPHWVYQTHSHAAPAR